MEALFALFLIFVGFAILRLIISAAATGAARTGRAIKDTVLGEGTFKQNMKASFTPMENFSIRLLESNLNEEPSSPIIKEVQCKGLFPIEYHRNLGIMVSAFDYTSGELAPVIALLEEFQELEGVSYQLRSNIGPVQPGFGITEWVSIGGVIPDIIQPPVSGTRRIRVLVRLIDLNNPPEIKHGFQLSNSGVLWQHHIDFTWDFTEKGYEEAQEHQEEATSISLKIGVAVAMSDGEMHDKEGQILKNWVKKKISFYSDEKMKNLKAKYNNALKESYNDFLNGNLILSHLVEKLNEYGDKNSKYEAIELGYDIMAADGVADPSELELLKNLANALGLDLDEIAKLRDKKLVNLDTSKNSRASIEEILDIDENWPDNKIKAHLRSEFNKWNNRLNTLPEGEQRDNAQRMLDLISEARQKYG